MSVIATSLRKAGKILALSIASALAFSAAVQAQTFPSKPITLIVPFTPGGSSDAIARKYAGQLEKEIGQPVIVENRGGASGAIGAGAAAKASPDGYTLLLAHTTGITVLPLIKSDLSYDPKRDLAPITLLGATPQVLVVHPSQPETLEAFIELARAKPGVLNYSSGGIATPPHLAGELFKLRTGLDIVHIPFNGSTPSITNLIGGQVNAAIQNIDSVLPHVKAGKLRALAVASDKRSTNLPDVPTFKEAGVDGVVNRTWFGIAVPSGTPEDVRKILEEKSVAVANSDEFKAFLDIQSAESVEPGSAAFAAFLDDESKRWAEVVQTANITLK